MSKWLGMGLLILFVAFPQTVKAGISVGLENGFLVLMPALFPYMVVSQIFVKTGGAQWVSRYCKVGKLSKKGVGILVPALFCGYPTGARLSALAYNNKEISKRELLLLFSFGNVPGFGFTVSYLGGVLYGSFSLGIQIYLAYITASLLLCTLFSMKFSKEKVQNNPNWDKALPFSAALVEAVTESSLAMVSLICFVCFFSSLNCFFSSLLQNPKLGALCSVFLEITSGLPQTVKLFPLSVSVFFAGFSGLCVMFQAICFDRQNAVNLLIFIISRSLYGMVSVLLFWGIRLIAG